MSDTFNFKKITPISNQFQTKYYIGPSCETNEGFYCTLNNSELVKSKKTLPLQINFLKKNEKNKLLDPVKINFGLHDTISCAHPTVWADTLMFFSSDLFAATGKIDLFYSVKRNGIWQTPVNCGPRINSEYNEAFPFFVNGMLYFSSDRPNGFGKLDIYQIDFFNKESSVKILSNPINSKADDFGVYIDSTFTNGYFSSNRSGNDDIYYYRTVIPFFDNCKDVESNNYCFTFYEEASLDTKDTLGLTYEWSFGDGQKKRGLEVSHCYKGEGVYLVELNVVDKSSGAVFFNEISYDFELKNIKQLYIHAPDTAQTNTNILFDPNYTNIDSLVIEKYFWDFGDGEFSFNQQPTHRYTKEGTFMVLMGIEGMKNGIKYKSCATKKIVISNKVDKPIFAFQPPIKIEPPINYAKMLKDSLAIYDKEFHDFIVKKEKVDSIAGTKTVFIPEIIKGSDTLVGINPPLNPDDKYKKVSNVFVFNEKDSTITYKVHIGVSEEKIDTNNPTFKGLQPISVELIDSMFHYFYGVTKTINEIVPYFDKAKEEGFKSSIVSAFQKEEMVNNPNLRHQFLMYRDTLKKDTPPIDTLKTIASQNTDPKNNNQTTVVTDNKQPNNKQPDITNKQPDNKNNKIPDVKNNNKNTPENKSNNDKLIASADIPQGHRVEIIASKTPKPLSDFNNVGKVTEVKSKDGYYRYYTEDVKSPENAKDLKDVLLSMGYNNAKLPNEEKTEKNINTSFLNSGAPGKIAYRVQVGAYKVRKPLSSFKQLSGYIKEIEAEDGYYKYVSEDVKTLENALDLQNALLAMGFKNSFVTAYEGNRRIPLIESILAGLSVYFNFDSYKVLPTEMEKIDFYFKKYANKNIKEVALEGNTCNLGSTEYNFGLSKRRVLAVEEALQPYVKVKINRKFLGEFYPLHNNSTESSRKLNRRVDVLIIN
ncbi:MAG: PKD domain-containing protein [Bacteroidia bacterium]|nr:PKD domain-containing protein [Bacteroidia bacterium]